MRQFTALRRRALFKVGAIDKVTMRNFDLILPCEARSMTPKKSSCCVRKIEVSQPVFANYLGTSESTIQKWETGAKRPGGPAL